MEEKWLLTEHVLIVVGPSTGIWTCIVMIAIQSLHSIWRLSKLLSENINAYCYSEGLRELIESDGTLVILNSKKSRKLKVNWNKDGF